MSHLFTVENAMSHILITRHRSGLSLLEQTNFPEYSHDSFMMEEAKETEDWPPIGDMADFVAKVQRFELVDDPAVQKLPKTKIGTKSQPEKYTKLFALAQGGASNKLVNELITFFQIFSDFFCA